MYSSNQNDYQKFSSSQTPSPPPPYTQSMLAANGFPVNPTAQYPYGNIQPPQQSAVQAGVKVPWTTGLCVCSDCSTCCMTCWCPCITFGRIAEIVDKGATSCFATGAIYALLTCLTGCGCLLSCVYRSKMRSQLMLPESPCGDCLVHCCCEQCALCQEYRELQNRGFDMSIGWQRNAERQNGGMQMAPVVQGSMSR